MSDQTPTCGHDIEEHEFRERLLAVVETLSENQRDIWEKVKDIIHNFTNDPLFRVKGGCSCVELDHDHVDACYELVYDPEGT